MPAGLRFVLAVSHSHRYSTTHLELHTVARRIIMAAAARVHALVLPVYLLRVHLLAVLHVAGTFPP